MTGGFIIWTLVSLSLAGIGVWALKSDKAVGFFAGVNPPEVSDIRRYNRAVAVLWFIYAALFELLGLPFLLAGRNSATFLCCFGAAPLSIGLMMAYHCILNKYRKK